MSISISVKPSITNRPVPLVRGQSRPRARGGAGIRLAALRVPLVAKLVGANLGVVAVLTAAWVASGAVMNAEVLLAILAVLVLHLVVIGIALRPIQDLEAVASRVWKGDFAARVEQSAVADDQVLRVGAMFRRRSCIPTVNCLLPPGESRANARIAVMKIRTGLT